MNIQPLNHSHSNWYSISVGTKIYGYVRNKYRRMAEAKAFATGEAVLVVTVNRLDDEELQGILNALHAEGYRVKGTESTSAGIKYIVEKI